GWRLRLQDDCRRVRWRQNSLLVLTPRARVEIELCCELYRAQSPAHPVSQARTCVPTDRQESPISPISGGVVVRIRAWHVRRSKGLVRDQNVRTPSGGRS